MPALGADGARRASRLAIVTCMDARIDPLAVFGLATGDAHIIRNAGGRVGPQALRSLTLSQRALGTREVLIAQHTGCGLAGLDDEEFAATLAAETGERPAWRAGGFADLEESVRALDAGGARGGRPPPPRPRPRGRHRRRRRVGCGRSPDPDREKFRR